MDPQMPSTALRTAKQTNMKDSDECILLIEAEAGDATVILEQLGLGTEERFQVEWITRLALAIERLRRGGIGAVVLDLALPDSNGIETLETILDVAPGMPVLILSGV